MTRLSQYFLPTEKQPPADAEALSHKLLVRAGMIRQVGAGLWSWLPAGWRVHQKAVQIIREEIDAIGGHEMLMPVLNPAEIWQRSGRYDAIGGELFRLKDRRGADMVLAMTHEEIVTTHIAQVVRSYRDLPQILYHFQIKERDEPRPRAGVLRTREFIMKDSYTFDRDAAGLDVGYEKHRERLRQDLRPLRPGVVPGRLRRRDDGRHRRARVHGAVPGGRERRRAGRRATRPTSRSRPRRRSRSQLPPALDAPVEESTPGLTTVAQVARGARRPRGRADQGLPGHRGRGRAAPGPGARRPPRQRHQARQRARRLLPPGARERVRRAHRPGGLHRAGRHRRADPARLRARRRLLHLGRQPGRRAPARRQAGPRLRVHRGRRAHGRGGGHRRRPRDPDRARDRDRQHLQARDPLQRAAGRDLPGRVRHGSARLDGLLRHRPGAHRRGGRRAVRRREGHLVAALAVAVRRAPRRARQAGHRGVRAGRAALRRAARGRPGRRLRRSHPRPGRQVRRRRAARRAAAADDRPAHARGGRARDAGPARA